ncbi:DUF4870 domain-containing protein [Engelhardtia mirabilis]|uniref:DUF4870 domain-containing protein n=1 Tax=Engelhardtia mirabilis TaxID=2528011 RepID=A0A518BPW3_9BACT|nr:hypothetical protein Pla133_41330 [Planctomycetes bacterium Pla133]QDV03344.1 hypothetical protein Pla86_41320 [Planctomycetes bacterium Pla86]
MDTPPPTRTEDPTTDERTLGCLAHLSAFAGFLVPFGNVIGPLVIWLNKRDDSPFVAEHARRSLNFQISAMVFFAAWVFVLIFSLHATGGRSVFVLVPVLLCAWSFEMVCAVRGAMRGNEGREYRYPISLDWV